MVGFGVPALVFDGIGAAAVEFDDIRLADKSQAQGTKGKIPRDAGIAAGFMPGGMDMVVGEAPLGREAVLAPNLLDMDQRALPLAIQQVLQGGKGQEIIFGVGHGIETGGNQLSDSRRTTQPATGS